MSDVISVPASAQGTVYKAQLLDYYYTRRAASAIGQGSRFQMIKAWWGTSSLVTPNPAGGFKIADIPTNFADNQLLNKFAESQLVCTLVGSTINISTVVPQASLKDGQVSNFNTLCLVDDQNHAFAVLCAQQDTIFKGKDYSMFVSIEQRA